MTAERPDNPERPVRVFLSADIYRDGRGAAFAWVNETTGKRRSEDVPSVTKIEVEYHGLLSALKGLPEGAQAQIISDSPLLCGQFYEVSPVPSRVLALSVRTLWVIRRRRLDVTVLCVPRADNPAWKRLRKGRWQRG
ncbi:MAG: hypothetical protein ABSG26_04670 [Bryobacteraceae bacterium]|jgi:hypothetical protein